MVKQSLTRIQPVGVFHVVKGWRTTFVDDLRGTGGVLRDLAEDYEDDDLLLSKSFKDGV